MVKYTFALLSETTTLGCWNFFFLQMAICQFKYSKAGILSIVVVDYLYYVFSDIFEVQSLVNMI